jgi:peptidoglycan/LPS O-acetylase OafA/YrhL
MSSTLCMATPRKRSFVRNKARGTWKPAAGCYRDFGSKARPRDDSTMFVRSTDSGACPKQISASSKGELPSLTALRGIAALWVVLYHYSSQCFPSLDATPYTYLIQKGYLAVDMFFMLSGFVLTHVYHRAFSESVTRHYWSFIAARIARIYPLHILILLLFVATAVASHLTAGALHGALRNVPLQGSESVEAFIANIFMLQGLEASKLSWNYPAWSISVEFIAYLLFPLALPAIWRASARIKIVVGLFLFSLLVLLASLTNGNFDQWDGPITLLRCLPEFILGTLLYFAFSAASANAWLARDMVAFSILAFIFLSLHLNAPDLLIVCLFAALILAAVLNIGSFSKWANAIPLIWLGNISYSLYLIHGFVQLLADKSLGHLGIPNHADLSITSSLALMFTMVCLCLVAAHFSYGCIEVGCRQYLRNLFNIGNRRLAKEGSHEPRWRGNRTVDVQRSGES